VHVLTKKAGSQRDLTEAGQQQRQQLRQQQQQQQQWVELRIASHHEVAEHRGCYLMQDYEQLMFFMSLITQILRWGAVCRFHMFLVPILEWMAACVPA
jgi:hypothetical protein